MLDITGGDAAALAEVTAVLDVVSAQDDPDLAAALRAARHRDHLTDRNTSIPTGLPAVWAALGQHVRAEALARSITDVAGQAYALAAVAVALARAGRHEQAGAVAAEAEAVARSIPNPEERRTRWLVGYRRRTGTGVTRCDPHRRRRTGAGPGPVPAPLCQ